MTLSILSDVRLAGRNMVVQHELRSHSRNSVLWARQLPRESMRSALGSHALQMQIVKIFMDGPMLATRTMNLYSQKGTIDA